MSHELAELVFPCLPLADGHHGRVYHAFLGVYSLLYTFFVCRMGFALVLVATTLPALTAKFLFQIFEVYDRVLLPVYDCAQSDGQFRWYVIVWRLKALFLYISVSNATRWISITRLHADFQEERLSLWVFFPLDLCIGRVLHAFPVIYIFNIYFSCPGHGV